MVDEGICTPEDIDKAVRFGFGFRYIAAGPAMQRDHAGLEVHGAGGTTIYPTLNNSPTIAKCLSDRIASGKFGMKTGEGFSLGLLKRLKQSVSAIKMPCALD